MEGKFAVNSIVKLKPFPPGISGIVEKIINVGGLVAYGVRFPGQKELSFLMAHELRVKPKVQQTENPCDVSANTVPTVSPAATKATCQPPKKMGTTTSTLVGPVALTSTASAQTLPTESATVFNSAIPTTTRVLRSSMQRMPGKSSRGKDNVAGYEAKQKECNSNDQQRGRKRTKEVAKVAGAAKSSRKNAKQTSPDVADGPNEGSQGPVGTCAFRSNQQPNRNDTHTTPPNTDNNSQHANLFDVPLIDATMGPSAKVPKRHRSK